MIEKNELPIQFQPLYEGLKTILTQQAFEIWCQNIQTQNLNPLPANYLKKKPSKNELLQQARNAVSGYSENNGARKAVEILADALEGK